MECEKCTKKKRCVNHSLAGLYPEVLRYWDFDRNLHLNPYKLGIKSSKSAWFRCPSPKNCGHHVWRTRVGIFTSGSRCPFCANRSVCPCTNAWENTERIQEFWDFTKNTVNPQEIYWNSSIKCFFRCVNGHSYVKRLDTFVRNPMCPYCKK